VSRRVDFARRGPYHSGSQERRTTNDRFKEDGLDVEEKERPIKVDILTVGLMQTACYVVADKETDGLLVIDPGGDAEMILESVSMTGCEPAVIVNTHGHGDHIAANGALKKAYPDAPLCIHRADADMLTDPEKNLSALFDMPVTSPPADRLLAEGDEMSVGENTLSVIHLPGHTPGGIGLYWPGTDVVAGMLFCGDTLFAGGVGRTDFPGGDEKALMACIRGKLFTLPDDTFVLPGHGPATTIGREKQTNPFFTSG